MQRPKNGSWDVFMELNKSSGECHPFKESRIFGTLNHSFGHWGAWDFLISSFTVQSIVQRVLRMLDVAWNT